MRKEFFPKTPQQAYTGSQAMAKELKMSLVDFTTKAGVNYSSVYRWARNVENFSVKNYFTLVAYYERHKPTPAKKKARK